ncbi:hypothetical protein MFLAVUS_003725 [Mucor flavus]|uniref:PHD-type domain-containing protein n=1 Tax=Mucor flavus TaxID=439312 RepID=A0ABP9YTW5_9FUNG
MTSKLSVIESQKEEFQPTVLSQSFTNNLFSSYYIQPFWESLLQQQTNHTNTFAKPIGASSPDSYHENNHPAVIPIGAPRMAIDDLITGPTQDSSLHQFMLLSHQLHSNMIHTNSLVIKDDVFLAQPSTLSRDALYPSWLPTAVIVDHDDTASLSSHSSLSSSQHSDKFTTSPCLSPVTSPTNFLYNHEPLFEGGIIEDLDNKSNNKSNNNDIIDQYFEDEEYDDLSSVVTDSTTSEDKQQQQMIRRLSTVSDDLDWFKLLDAFRADVACDLPETNQEEDDQVSSESSHSGHTTAEEEDDEEEEDEYDFYVQPTVELKKRKRVKSETLAMYQLNLSDDNNDNDDDDDDDHAPIKKKSSKNNVRSNPSQKRRKKSKATSFNPRYKKYQKKKTADNQQVEFNLVPFTHTHIKKDKKEECDQNKESISSPTRSQLIESVAEKDKKTVFQHLTEVGIDWCRYCGTTEGVNWRPGPWGKRTLCNKHGCDYKGYGLASRLPRLDLSAFSNEKLEERLRPVVQQFCIVCQSPEQTEQNNHLVLCSGGCSRAYHQHCHTPMITVNPAIDPVRWYCSALCKENRKRNKVVVELPPALVKACAFAAQKSRVPSRVIG